MMTDRSVNILPIFIGTPFDPTEDFYQVQPRADFRSTGIAKAMDTGKVFERDEDPAHAAMCFLYSCRGRFKYPSVIGHPAPIHIPIASLFYEEANDDPAVIRLIGHVERVVGLIGNDPVKLTRLALMFSERQQVFINHRLDKNPSDASNLWPTKMLLKLFKEAEQYDAVPVIDELVTSASSLFNTCILAGGWSDERLVELVGRRDHFERFLSTVFCCARNNDVEENDFAFRTIWHLAYLFSMPVFFIYAMKHFDINVERSKYPFINFELIDFYNEWFDEELQPFGNGPCMSNMEIFLKLSPSLDMVSALIGEYVKEAPTVINSRGEVELNQLILDTSYGIATNMSDAPRSLKEVTELCSDVCDRSEFVHCSSFASANPNIHSTLERISELVFRIEHEIDLSSITSTQFKSISRLACLSEINTLSSSLCVLIPSVEALIIDLDEIDVELGQALLEARDKVDDDAFFDRITEMRQQKHALKTSLDERFALLAKQSSAYERELTLFCDALTDASTETNEANPPSDNNQYTQKIEELTLQLEKANAKIKKTSQKLAEALNSTSKSAEKNHVNASTLNIDLIATAVDGDLTMADALQLLHDVNGGHVVISPKAWDSVRRNTDYTRIGFMIRRLSTLMSKDFISAFTHGGSEEAFTFFTKKMLSFNESETTMSAAKNSRVFEFDDGKSRLCESHLRLGTSGNPQHMLRIYFTIENSKLYIGEIVPHLPVSKKF